MSFNAQDGNDLYRNDTCPLPYSTGAPVLAMRSYTWPPGHILSDIDSNDILSHAKPVCDHGGHPTQLPYGQARKLQPVPGMQTWVIQAIYSIDALGGLT